MTKAEVYILMVIAVVGMLFSCESKDYDTGDGKYSYLHEDMVDVTVQNNLITSVVTDDGETLGVLTGQTVNVTPADTTLRWLLYYNKVGESNAVTFLGRKSVSVLTPKTEAQMRQKYPSFVMKTDTVKVNSVWLAKNNKYLNLNIGLWVGNTSSTDNLQKIGMVKDRESSYGKGRIYYTFYHDQADVPVGYYTQDTYISVPTTEQDTIDVCIGHTHYIEIKKQ